MCGVARCAYAFLFTNQANLPLKMLQTSRMKALVMLIRRIQAKQSQQGLVLYVWLWTRWAAQRASAEVGDARFTVRAHLIFLKISCFTYAHAQIRK